MRLGPVPGPTGSGTFAMPRQVQDVNTTALKRTASPRRPTPATNRTLSAHRFGLLFAPPAFTPRLTGPAPVVRAADTTAAAADSTRRRRSAVRAGWFPAAGA